MLEGIAASFGAAFMFAGLRSFQQLNVVAYRRLAVVLTSFLIAFFECVVVKSYVASSSYLMIFAIGAGAGVGCVSFMELSRRLFKRG